MSSPTNSNTPAPIDLSPWRRVPTLLIAIGGVLAAFGAFHDYKQFSYSWLLAFMFFLSLGLGGLILVILHHLFDAAWSVVIRRVCEHLACLLPIMAFMFIPIALNVLFASPEMQIYPWIKMLKTHEMDHALASKQPLFTVPSFFIVAAICFGSWWLFSNRLRYWSLQQDVTGAAVCTRMMRRYAAFGVFFFAITLTFAAIMWMKALQHEWFSTMYGVYYFAGSVWMTIFTVYVLTALLKRQGPLRPVATEKTFYFIGTLMFAFTVFYAYITFFQYFIIWNANVPEETFFYVLRERGNWFWVSMLIIFGHFFLPFLLLLRIDVKLTWLMIPLAVWAWIMHFVDMSFNIMPVLHPEGYHLDWMDLACVAFIGGVLAKMFLKSFNAHPPFPQKDPRIAETMDVYVAPDEFVQAATARGINHKSGGSH
ncbi:MAG: hypothetical protein JWR69_157 [Pedosphaera sp.]|nr:hypothetical protein [Pedosphaera sp.]